MQVQRHQINALLRKSVAFQKKNWAQNCCVIACPLVLIALLGGIQVLIDKLLDEPDAKVRRDCCAHLDGPAPTQMRCARSVSVLVAYHACLPSSTVDSR